MKLAFIYLSMVGVLLVSGISLAEPAPSEPSRYANRQFLPLSDIPKEVRAKINFDEVQLRSAVQFVIPTIRDIEVQVNKPWLAKPKQDNFKSGAGYCPLKISYGVKQVRQEERSTHPWPYAHREFQKVGEIEYENETIRNLGNFYALIDPVTGQYATYSARASMPWHEAVTQNQIDDLCKQALEASTKSIAGFTKSSTIVRSPLEDIESTPFDGPYPNFITHLPRDAKQACPGGGRDTFAATYGVFFTLEKEVALTFDSMGRELIDQTSRKLVCSAHSQVCCFDSEAPWPLHSLYPLESGAGYDEPDPDFVPDQNQMKEINYAYSFLGSKGLYAPQLQNADRVLPSTLPGKDTWLQRISPIFQPPRSDFPTAENIIEIKSERRLPPQSMNSPHGESPPVEASVSISSPEAGTIFEQAHLYLTNSEVRDDDISIVPDVLGTTSVVAEPTTSRIDYDGVPSPTPVYDATPIPDATPIVPDVLGTTSAVTQPTTSWIDDHGIPSPTPIYDATPIPDATSLVLSLPDATTEEL